MKAAAIIAELETYTGSEKFTRHRLNHNVIMTDGIVRMRELCRAFWLIDDIALYQAHNRLMDEDFQLWRITRKGAGALLEMTDGHKPKPLFSVEIGITDFPLDCFEFYGCRNEFNGITLLLKSEY